jgi:hypothetical protein
MRALNVNVIVVAFMLLFLVWFMFRDPPATMSGKTKLRPGILH